MAAAWLRRLAAITATRRRASCRGAMSRASSGAGKWACTAERAAAGGKGPMLPSGRRPDAAATRPRKAACGSLNTSSSTVSVTTGTVTLRAPVGSSSL